MNQEVQLSTETFIALHDDVRTNSNDISDNKTKLIDLEKRMDSHEEKIADLQEFRTINEATLRYVIKEELQPLVQQVHSLENDKFKVAFEVLKWLLIVAGGGVVTYMVSQAIASIVN